MSGVRGRLPLSFTGPRGSRLGGQGQVGQRDRVGLRQSG